MSETVEKPKEEEKPDADDDAEGELIPKKKLTNRLAQKERLHQKEISDLKKSFEAQIEEVKKTAAVIAEDNPKPEEVIMENVVTPVAAPAVDPAQAAVAPAPAPTAPVAAPMGAVDPLANLTPEQIQRLSGDIQKSQQEMQMQQQRQQVAQEVAQEKESIIKNIDEAMDNDAEFKQMFTDNAAKLPPQFFAGVIDLLVGDPDGPAVFKKLIGTQEGINTYINASPIERTKLLNRLGKQVHSEKLGDMTPTAMTSFATKNNSKSSKSLDDMTSREYAAHMKSRGMY